MFFIFNGNKSKKKQTISASTVTLSIAVLMMFGQFNIARAESVGLLNHNLEEGKVTLLTGSMVVSTKEDLEEYKKSFADACDIDFDGGGNIRLHYKSQGTTKDKGCTVDLLTNDVDEIKFTAGLSHSTALIDCIKEDMNLNILPFAYSLTNEELKSFTNGPIFGGDGCDSRCEKDMCVNKTGLEIRWKHSYTYIGEAIGIYSNPIGTTLIYDSKQLLDKQKQKGGVIAEINQTDPKYHIKFLKEIKRKEDQGKAYQGKAFCMKGIENILSPSTWEIVGKSPDPEKNRLLVFHLLPQKASRNLYRRTGESIHKYEEGRELPNGPRCDDLKITFMKDRYRLVTKPPSPDTTTTSNSSKTSTFSTTTSSTTSTSTTTKKEPPPLESSSTQEITKDSTENKKTSKTSTTNEENSVSTSKENQTNSTTINQAPETKTTESVTTSTFKGFVLTTAIATTTNNTTTINTTTTSSSNAVLIIIVIVVIMIIVGIGIAVYFLVIRKGAEKKEENAEGGDEIKRGLTEVEATNIKEDDEKEGKEKEGDELKDDEEGGNKKKDLSSETEGETEMKEEDNESENQEDNKEDDDIYT